MIQYWLFCIISFVSILFANTLLFRSISYRIVSYHQIVDTVTDGKTVSVSNFGAFDSYMSKPSTGRNPKTNEAIKIPSKKRIRFKAYDAFKKA